MAPFDPSVEKPNPAIVGQRWRREGRSAWLRLIVLLILLANLSTGEEHADLAVQFGVAAAYALATATAIALAMLRRGPSWVSTALIVLDALLVLALFHEHLFARRPGASHALDVAGMAVSFLLLNHVALRLRADLVSLFAGLVLAGWLPLVVLSAFRSGGQEVGRSIDLGAEAALASAFAFAASTLYLLVSDHAALIESAIASERRRARLSRFFAPTVVAELEAMGGVPALEQRDAAVLFVDLRSFSRFSENVEAREVASMLSEYRDLVVSTVFGWGGTVDKFIGDGVMAVFGHPRAAPDDAERALRCALELSDRLADWAQARRRDGRHALKAGIGVHYGPVMAGVLSSGGHHEFSVFGDAVNVAERLERATKALDASTVISRSLLDRVPPQFVRDRMVIQNDLRLGGRSEPVDVGYVPRPRELEPAVSA